MAQGNSGCHVEIKAAIIGSVIAGLFAITTAIIAISPLIADRNDRIATQAALAQTPTITLTSQPTVTPTELDIASIVGTLDAQATIDQASLNARSTIGARITEDAVGTQSIVKQTATATLWTATPTANITASIEAYRTQQGQTAIANQTETATLWTPTETYTPSVILTPTNTPTPQNGLITFARDGDIYTMRVDGSDAMLLKKEASNDDPAWSPNGQFIAFTSYQGVGLQNIYLMAADGSNVILQLTTEGNNFDPAWSPDGQQIAFKSYRDGKGDIYVMAANGSNVIRLTTNGNNDAPTWSPDGQKIAFQSKRDGEWNIYVMKSDGSEVSRLTIEEGKNPAWSPDGQRVAFVSARTGAASIYVMNIDSITAKLLATQGYNNNPTWSPDGKRIAFEQDGDVYVMEADGSGITRLTTDGGFNPSWPGQLHLNVIQ